MRFLSAADRLKMVVRPAWKEQVGPNLVPHRGLTARFINHVFDSQKSQRDLGWTDEERKSVERHLLTHSWFDRPNGIYLEELKAGEQAKDVAEVLSGKKAAPAAMGMVRCVSFFRNEQGEPEQCPHEAAEGSDLCKEHLAASEGANAEAAPSTPPMPDTEEERQAV